MVRSPPRRKATTVSLLAVMVIASLAGVAYHHAPAPVRLSFGEGDGTFRTQSGHGASTPDALVDIVQRTAGAYIEQLEVLRPFTVFDSSVNTPLLNVTAHIDALGPNETYIETGYANITIDGLLSQVPAGDVDELVANLTGQGFDLVDELTAEPSPSPSASPSPSPSPSPSDDPLPIAEDPFYLEYTDNGTRYLVIRVAPMAERVDVIVLETPAFGGLHVTTTPFVVAHRSGNGTLLDLVVRNPIEASVGALSQPVIITDITCSEGECIPETTRDLRVVCTESGVCPDIPGAHITDLTYAGGPVTLPGELLHLWSEDAVHGSAGIGVLGNDTMLLAGDRWTGDPFGGALTLHDNMGQPLATFSLQLPSPTDTRLGFTLDGPIVQTLAGSGLAHHEGLDQYQVHLIWGPIHLSNADVYGAFDLANGLLSGTWSDSDGQIRAAHLTALIEPADLLTLVETARGDVEATIQPLQAQVVYAASRIEALGTGLVPVVQGLPGPAERAAFDIVNVTTGEAEHQVRLVEGTVGCGLTTLGCLGLILGPAGDLLEGNGLPRPPSEAPDPQTVLDGAPVQSDEIIAYINTVSGTVLGYFPGGDEPIPCADSSTPLTCLLTASPGELAGAVVGFVGGSVPAFGFVGDVDNRTVGVYDGTGAPIAAYEDATLHAAGHTAILGEDPLLSIMTPTGRTLCIRHTFDADAMQNGAWPSLEAGCDGIAGIRTVVQPGATYAFAPDGNLQEIAIYHPADRDHLLLYYHDDGETTTILPHPTTGADPVVVSSTLVHVSGDPATASSYRIDIADASRSGDGLLRSVQVARDAWYATEHIGRGTLPGTYASLVFDISHGPEVDLLVSDGRTTLSPAHGALAANRWLSGLEANTWLVTQEGDASPRLDLLYRLNDRPTIDGDRVAFATIGYNATTGDRILEATLDASTLAGFQTGGTMHFGLAWTTRHGPITTTVVDDRAGAFYRYHVDTDAPGAHVTAPATSAAHTFTVGWSGFGERGSGLSTFRIERDDGTGWSPWIGGRHVTEPMEARFTGQPGSTYHFRAQACDLTGNCGPWSSSKTTTIAGAAAPPPVMGPVLHVLAPADGATVSDFVALAWTIDHDAATAPLATVEVRGDGETAWTSLYSGHRTSTTWDTNHLWDGGHTIRYTASDGTRSDVKTIHVQVDNDRPRPTLDVGSGEGASGGAAPLPGDGTDGAGKKKDTPIVGLPFVLVGILALLGVLRRKRA